MSGIEKAGVGHVEKTGSAIDAEGGGHAEKVGLSIDPTEFREGWRVLLLSLVGIATGINGVGLYTFGSFVVPLQQAFGWKREQIQPAVGVMTASVIVAVTIAGVLIRRFGLRAVTLVSLVALSIGYWIVTLNTGSLWRFYASFSMLAFVGMGTMHVTWTQLVNLWFERNRGLALAFMLCGTGLAALIYPTSLSWAISQWGWRGGFWLLSVLTLLVTLPLSFLWLNVNSPAVVRRLSESKGRAEAGKEPVLAQLPGLEVGQVVRQWRFWLCNVALSLVVSTMVAMVTSAIPMLRDRGLSAAEAAAVFSWFGVSLIFSRVVVGYLVDRLWAPGVAAVVTLCPAIGTLLFYSLGVNTSGLSLASALVGLGAGAEMDIAAFLLARYFGMRDYSRVFSLHMVAISTASTIAPLVVSVLYVKTGGYASTLLVCTASCTLGAILLPAMGRYPNFSQSAAKQAEGAAAPRAVSARVG